VPTEAGWRSTVRKSIALLVPQPGQKTASHGVPASSAAAGDLTPLCAPSAGLGSPNQRPISAAIPVCPAIHRVARRNRVQKGTFN
jgi:hypothetical protein